MDSFTLIKQPKTKPYFILFECWHIAVFFEIKLQCLEKEMGEKLKEALNLIGAYKYQKTLTTKEIDSNKKLEKCNLLYQSNSEWSKVLQVKLKTIWM